ncbi:hypothetical protein CSDY_1028 [Streptococcus dysgalactiae]
MKALSSILLICSRLGLIDKSYDTYGSVKVQDGVPLEVLAKWFGHKDTSMLRCIYIHLLDETRNEWFEKEKMLSGKCSGKA